MGKISKKIKTLAMILNSLAPEVREVIAKQLPTPIVDKIETFDPGMEEELAPEDWEHFYQSWPEFANIISSVQTESKNQKLEDLLLSERTKVTGYMEFKLNKSNKRPNLSSSISRIIDQYMASAR